MMKYLQFTTLVLYFFLLAPSNVVGQNYGNEWINYNQKYFAFKSARTGLKRINYDDLLNAGVPLNTFSHHQIQMFNREKEIPIYVETNGDDSFDSGDYLLFYGERNDGWKDKNLYVDPNGMASEEISLFNDTIYYFFTWNSSTNNFRFTAETSDNFDNYAPASYVWDKVSQSFANHYIEGETLMALLSSSFYVNGEGFGRTRENGAGTIFNLPITAATNYPYTGIDAPSARFHSKVSTASNAEVSGGGHNQHTRWKIGNEVIYDSVGVGYFQYNIHRTIPASSLGHTTNLVWSIVGDSPAATMYQSLTYWSIEYARQPNFVGLSAIKFWANNSNQSKGRVDVAGVNLDPNVVYFSFGSHPKRIFPQFFNGTAVLLHPNNMESDRTMIVGEHISQAEVITQINPVNGTGYFTNYSTANYDKAYIIVYHPVLEGGANEYHSYRSSVAGGNKNVLMANVEELYLQFGGGIPKHVSGIRGLIFRAHDTSNEKPEAVFLLGKGLDHVSTRGSVAGQALNLIPTLGWPASDILLASRMTSIQDWKPIIPIGRLSINTNEGIKNYLSKITEYEANQNQSDVYDSPSKDWQKHIIHLIGGTDANQQIAFESQMNMMKYTIEHEKFGAKVHTLKRENSDPISPTSLQEIMDRISKGVSIMTYYGHKGIGDSGFEINLDEVANWNNTGKYPLMIANSCYNGDIFQPGLNSSSEYFVNTQNLGAIGYISSVSTGFHPYVGVYSNRLYEEIGKFSHTKSIAENMANAIESLQGSSNMYMEVTATQMLLNGDPALKVNYHRKPEIELLDQNVFFKPDYVDLNTDSIEMYIVLKNLGHSITDSFNIEIKRSFPGSNTDSLYNVKVPYLHYMDTIKFKFPLQPSIASGLNIFDIKVDIPSFIEEQYDEINNNQILKNYYLNLDGILPVVPYEFAVVPNDTLTLKASTINPLAAYNTYRFQIDTTDLFNSPFLKNATVSGYGGVKEVKPNDWDSPLQFTDSTVYFWRVAVDGSNPSWSESSFQYIKGKSGWGQDHFFQFKKNTFGNVVYNRDDRVREWVMDSISVTVDVFADIVMENAYYINGTMQDYAVCSWSPPIHVAVIDPVSFETWGTNFNGENPDHDFGNSLCRNRVEKFFIFYQDNASSLASFQNMINNGIPDGHYFLIYTPITTRYDWWSQLDSVGMYSLFANIGAPQINPSRSNYPFALFARKGYPNSAKVSLIDPNTGAGSETNYYSTSLTAYMPTSITQGQEVSTIVGPSQRWGNLYWKQDSADQFNNADTTRLIIIPYKWDMVAGSPINLLFSNRDSLINLENVINAVQYPYLRLKAAYQDSVNYTPAQIDSWHVLYDQVPEAAIDASNGYYFSHANDSIHEGQTLKFAADIRNIFSIDMDSLLVKYWITDNQNVKHLLPYQRQDSLRVGEVLRDTVVFSTVGLAGYNSLWMEVNPYINQSIYIKDQPEQTHFNNILQIPFYVAADKINPLLDVTFDGRHILNGDIISPTAEIVISLKDENPYLIMDMDKDTTLFGIYLTDPTGTMRRIPFVDGNGQTVMQWIHAESSQKKFKIIYPAGFTMDGKYRLFVQGTDRSGNYSGDYQYKVDFEVVSGSSITHMMNYPNPFSTSTQFVFTLTGSEIPDDIIIQIMTVSGRVVREITEDQLGPIHIGRNITSYAWDGRDEFGDQLANGVYLYTVKAKINGEDIEHRDSGADKYFKKSFGKMYLMR